MSTAPQPSTLTLYNSLTRRVEPVTPQTPGELKMYSCGPTVYDRVHIGNLRAYLVPDLIVRWYAYFGFTVHATMNVTDFGHLSDDRDDGEDKIQRAMRRAGYTDITTETMRTFTDTYISQFRDDSMAFGNDVDALCITRASDYIAAQRDHVATLLAQGFAYETSDGIYFEVQKFPSYGALGNRVLEAQHAGARVAENPEKRHPADFALWKKSKRGYESPWGRGFPGWHIECTAMAFATLGTQLDIHTGGEDLQYTHHNAEIAQAEAVADSPYVRYWVHNAHVLMGDSKLSKSAGGAPTLGDLTHEGYHPLALRYLYLTTHYRSPLHFRYQSLDAAAEALERIWSFLSGAHKAGALQEPAEADVATLHTITAAIAHDLDTPAALATLSQFMKNSAYSDAVKVATLYRVDSLLGLGFRASADTLCTWLRYVPPEAQPEHVRSLINAREHARTQKDFATADKLREELAAHGYMVEDTPTGTKLRLARRAPTQPGA